MPFRTPTFWFAFLALGRLQVASAAAPLSAFVEPKWTSFRTRSNPTRAKPMALAPLVPKGNDAPVVSSAEYHEPGVVVDRVFAQDRRPVILFDGVCNLCNGAVNLALDWDPHGRLRFSALQSNVGRALLRANGRAPDDLRSIVLVTPDGAFVKSDAILKIAESLTPFRFLPLRPVALLGAWLVPRFLRDLIYDGVADNRYKVLGKQDQCRFDADGAFEDRFVNDNLALKQPQN